MGLVCAYTAESELLSEEHRGSELILTVLMSGPPSQVSVQEANLERQALAGLVFKHSER